MTDAEIIKSLQDQLTWSTSQATLWFKRSFEDKGRAVMWHGKWAIVKHENNVLRRKLRLQEDKIALAQQTLNKMIRNKPF